MHPAPGPAPDGSLAAGVTRPGPCPAPGGGGHIGKPPGDVRLTHMPTTPWPLSD